MRVQKLIAVPIICLLGAMAAHAADLTQFMDARIDVDDGFGIFVNGESIHSDVGPVVMQGTVMVPVRFVSEKLGMEVEWDPKLHRVTLIGPQGSVSLTIGNHRVWVDNQWKELSLAPVIYQGRTMVPYEALDVRHLLAQSSSAGPLPIERPAMAAEAQDRPDSGPADQAQEAQLLPSMPESLQFFRYLFYALWVIGLVLLVIRRSMGGRNSDAVHWLSVFLLFVVSPAAYYGLRSSYFSAAVAAGAAIIGLISKEDVIGAVISIADSAQVLGLLGTLLGLGPIIGPAIAQKNVQAIGYGLSVVVETTIIGIVIALVANAVRSRIAPAPAPEAPEQD